MEEELRGGLFDSQSQLSQRVNDLILYCGVKMYKEKRSHRHDIHYFIICFLLLLWPKGLISGED